MKHVQIFLKGVGYAEFQNEKKFILLAHSQGGLYAQQFARTYPDMFGGIVFVDPLSANDNRYKKVYFKREESITKIPS